MREADFFSQGTPPTGNAYGERVLNAQDEAGHASTHDGAGNEREGANAESRGPASHLVATAAAENRLSFRRNPRTS
jgi:hypothetical protein